MKRATWTVVAVLGVLGAVGCGGSSDNNMDMATLCTPSAKTCLDNRTKLICNEAGDVQIPAPCASGEICDGGECKADPAVACTDDDNGCTDDSTAMRCTAAHKGFDVLACPPSTKCTGKGDCMGNCIVGSSYCGPNNTLVSCVDGLSYTTTTCDTGKACVTTKGDGRLQHDPWSDNPLPPDPHAVAECKPADCYPDYYTGCNTVCGNRSDAAAPNQDKTTSTCTETPDGWKWVVTSCGTGASCATDTNWWCQNNNTVQKTCAAVCTPGEQMCLDTITYLTCGADGQWAATPTACNASAGTIQYVCTPDPANGKKVQCADFVCANGNNGACDASGNFHACGADGKMAATGTACTGGVCVAQGGPQPGGISAGHCVAQCLAGEERCVAANGQGSTYQTCNNGVWGAAQNCANSDPCFQYTTPPPLLRKKLCGGVCAPGDKRCSNSGGTQVGSGVDHYFQVCGTDGKWAAATDCTVGTCSIDPSNPAVLGCVAECIPGAKVCLGGNTAVPNTPFTAKMQDGTCQDNGRLPAAGTNCPANTYCRKNVAGQALGCVACVGGQNEWGIADTKCGNAAGAAGTTNVFTCLANSSDWDIGGTLACGAPNAVCHNATTNINPPLTTGAYCHPETGTFGGNAPPLTQSYLMQGWGKTCSNNYWNNGWGVPVSCGLLGGGSVSDCCSSHCYAEPQPAPAYCGN
jgi:hypothetical protein